MMTAIMKKHLKKKKGFTLIEVVVVLVILAILAAIAIPALVGYIDDANQRAVTTEARTVLVGLQHMSSTNKADHAGATGTDPTSYFTTATGGLLSGPVTTAGTGLYQIKSLTGDTFTSDATYVAGTKNISGIEIADNKVTKFTYNNGSYTVTYTAANGFSKPTKNS